MLRRTKVMTGVLAALGGALLIGDQSAYAQSTERVEITGSRIRTIGAVSNSPVTSVTAEEFNASQPVAAEEIIRGLSASYPGIGPGTNNGSNGTASVDLRGLGTNRTLVLINGRRLVPATLGGVVDTNAIPVSLIDRIDVVTGGASAVYGADAVAGVVNFVLKKNFTGIEARTSYGQSQKGDAGRIDNYLTLGSSLADGRGNVALNVATTRVKELKQGDRDFGVYQLNSATGNRDGSSTAVPAIWAGLPAPLGGTRIVDYATGSLRAATAADNYNFNPPNYYQTPQERTQVSALGSFVINDNAEAYAELVSTKNKVVLNLAPSGSFTSAYSIPIGNPYIPDATRQQICAAYLATELAKPAASQNAALIAATQPAACVAGNTFQLTYQVRRRMTELGPRINDFDNTTQQWTVGVRGALPVLSSWNYDGYLQNGTSDQVSARVNWGSFSKLQQALQAVSTTTCTNPANGCVPINLFGQEGSITQSMLNFVNLTAVQTTKVEQQVANLTFSGDLGAAKSPLAKAPISLAVGAEVREVRAGNKSDAPSQIQGEVLGTGAPLPDRSGTIKLSEGFLETQVPILAGLPGVHSLGLEGGYRQTQFKTEISSKNYGSWKLGLDYAPMKGLRFRAMQQRATRAPNINELYAPVVTGLSNLAVDPCQGANINPADIGRAGTLTNLCVQTGVPVSQVGVLAPPSAGQVNNTGGGNPNLGPEEADTTTIGLVFEPDFVPGLTVTLDYYKIDVQKAVSSPTVPQVMNGCYSAARNPGFVLNATCANINRDPLVGGLNGGLGVITQSSNLGSYLVEGLDMEVKYRLSMASMGKLEVGLAASQLNKFDFKSLPTEDTLSFAGRYGLNSGNPYPKIKFTQSTKWDIGNFSVGYQWRYIDKVTVDPGTGTWFADYTSIKAMNYVDLNGYWDVTKNLRLSMSINNAFDTKPPIVGNTIGGTGPNSGNTFPQLYDVIGRYVAVAARLKF